MGHPDDVTGTFYRRPVGPRVSGPRQYHLQGMAVLQGNHRSGLFHRIRLYLYLSVDPGTAKGPGKSPGRQRDQTRAATVVDRVSVAAEPLWPGVRWKNLSLLLYGGRTALYRTVPFGRGGVVPAHLQGQKIRFSPGLGFHHPGPFSAGTAI